MTERERGQDQAESSVCMSDGWLGFEGCIYVCVPDSHLWLYWWGIYARVCVWGVSAGKECNTN